MKDILIIGAGIVGSSIAYACSKKELDVVLLEKNIEAMDEVSSANSGIVHAGYDPEEGTLKAKLNLRGSRLYPNLCRELKVGYLNCGAFIVAISEEETEILETLRLKAVQRDIPYEILTKEEALQQEPNLTDQVLSVLSFPSTAVVTPWEVGHAMIETAILNQVEFIADSEVLEVLKIEGGFRIITAKNRFEAKMVINSSGLCGDKVARLNRVDYPNVLSYRRGEYDVFDRSFKGFIDHVIYPVPTILGKGVLALVTVEGNIMIGPNSEVIDTPYDTQTTAEGLASVSQRINKTMKNLPIGAIIRQFAGVRPVPITKDFIIEEDTPNWINVIGIESPGLASAPAIAEMVMNDFIQPKFQANERVDYHYRNAPIKIMESDPLTRSALIKENPKYGKMVCLCEQVSEQEIVDCIHRPDGARSVKGVKKRVRPGSGRCQGGFCEPEIVKILARELKIDLSEVVYDTINSTMLKRKG